MQGDYFGACRHQSDKGEVTHSAIWIFARSIHTRKFTYSVAFENHRFSQTLIHTKLVASYSNTPTYTIAIMIWESFGGVKTIFIII